ncbi:L-type lectin-domain containing receptor kinase IX.1-like [Tasmannia lanceolata]|uniref:L-type lectin-domain containing receptor kinase IX.1-like n=1 Tax=Tasmannia lanceolata TaxID=3420 RepID=UPI004062911C
MDLSTTPNDYKYKHKDNLLAFIAAMLMLLLFSSLLHQTSLTFLEPITFSFPTFDPESCDPSGDLICTGTATAGHGYIDLTADRQTIKSNTSSMLVNNVGRVLYKQPVLAWPANLVTIFTVRISEEPNSTNHGDGVAFIITEDKDPSPDNSQGAFLGLYNGTNQGKIHQLAVELDTFMNEFDPDDNHIGIDLKRIVSEATTSLDSIGVDLKSGRDIKVKIEYNGWNYNLQISLGYSGETLIPILNYSVIMSSTVPKSVYVGFTGSTFQSFETHRILNWAFTSMPLPNYSLMGDPKSDKMRDILIIAFPIIVGILVIALGLLLVIRKAYRPKNENVREKRDIESRSRSAANAPKMFTFKQLSKATQNFSKQNLLGTGGFGSVFRGEISDPPSIIAVKKISSTSKQGEREYLAEICTIGRLRHKNIVQLQGWCHERDHLLLVYEYMPNGSLDRFISKGFLDWRMRYNVLTGLASALLYLHEDCGHTVVVHRDVKPNNVMLDANYNAHLGDFGLARLLQNETSVTTMLAGTPGYLAPECSYTGKATPESDVFGFGIVVLEVVCGRRSVGGIGENNLVDYVWELHGKGELLQGAVGPWLDGKFEEEELVRALVVGLSCSHPDPMLRPKMRKVVQVFTNSNEPLMVLPASRPNAIYVPVLSSSHSSNAMGSIVATTSSGLSLVSYDETCLEYGR